MELVNVSNRALQAPNLDKKGLTKLVVLPDYSPGKGILPTGTVAVYDQGIHTPDYRMLGPDIGCGMALAKFSGEPRDIKYSVYRIAAALQEGSPSTTGSLGGGNHFLSLYRVKRSEDKFLDEGDVVALVHVGSGLLGVDLFKNQLTGEEYLEAYAKAVKYAQENRGLLLDTIERESNSGLVRLLDLPHNTLEVSDQTYIYRKGAVRAEPGQRVIIPSSLGEDAVVVLATEDIRGLENSMCHGTGRKMPRSHAKNIPVETFGLRDRVAIPNFIYDDQLSGDLPHNYRGLDEVLPLIENYVRVTQILENIAFVN